jgi:hypothetical protein
MQAIARISELRGLDLPKEAADNMFQQSHSLLLHKLGDHVAQNRSHSVKSFVCSANICKTDIIKKYFLYNENGDGFAKLRACLHNAKAQRDDLGC